MQEQGQGGPASSVKQNPSPEKHGGEWLMRQPHVNRHVHPRVDQETCSRAAVLLQAELQSPGAQNG